MMHSTEAQTPLLPKQVLPALINSVHHRTRWCLCCGLMGHICSSNESLIGANAIILLFYETKTVTLLCATVKGALDAGPDEGGAMGHDSDEEEKRANRARAANADQGSTAEGRNQDAATDVRSCILQLQLF